MRLIGLKCAFCSKPFYRERGRYNEAKKFGWNQFCSLKCQFAFREVRIKIKCGNPDCRRIILRYPRDIKRSKSDLVFCSATCAAIVNNRIRQGLDIGFRRHYICPI